MELFSVLCTTCNSKLKVRDRGAIGQILACPKCSGMVLVQPPAGWTDPGEQAASAPLPVAAAPAAAPLPSPSSFEDAAALLEKQQPAEPVAAPPVQPSAAPAPLPAAPVATLSPQTQAMQRWLLFGGLTAVGIAVAAGVVISFFGGDETVVVASDDPPPVIAPADDEEKPAEETPVVGEEPRSTDPQPADPPVDDDPPSVDPAPPREEAKPQPMPPMVATDPPAEEKPPIDEAPKPINSFNIENTLNEFGGLLEDKPFEPGDNPPAPPMPMPPPDPASPETPIVATEDEPLARPERRKIEIARRLNDPLEAIELSDVPLADFLRFVSDLTAMPITLDTTALPAIKASPETKISVSLKATKIGDVLAAALRPHGLAYVATDTQVVVLPAASAKSELREIKHDVTDLAASEAEVKVLAEAIHAVIEPQGWDDAGGLGMLRVEGTSLVVTHTPEVHYAIVLLCEKLRLARKLPARSNYPPAVLTLAPRASEADAALAKVVTMNFVPPTRLGRVADYIRSATGVRVLIDWRALDEAGWTVDSEVKAGVANQPVSAFLDRLARRMEIAWRVLDSNTVELTTPAALLRSPDVEVYPLASGDSAALLARLQSELGANLFEPGSGAALRYDSAGQCLIARLPQPQQLRLIAALAKE